LPTTTGTIIASNASGNVGIGTTNPGTRTLAVVSATDKSTIGVFSGASYGVRIGTIAAGGGVIEGVDVTGSTSYQPLVVGGSQVQFTTSGTERMRIDSSGNVGIGTVSPANKLDVSGLIRSNNGGSANFALFDGTTTGQLQQNINTIYLNSNSDSASPGQFIFRSSNSFTTRMTIDTTGALILAGSTAQKATGTTWSNPSDQRLKDNIRDYTKGTTELMQVRVREWEYNGKGGTTEGMKGLGVVADEVMTVLPNTVETYDAKLNSDDEETTAIKKFDATEITWLLVKTVQEQQTIINDLKARVETLEAK
jgi:hypothetical protein